MEDDRIMSVEEFEALINETPVAQDGSHVDRPEVAEEAGEMELNPYGDILPDEVASVLDEVLAELDDADTIQPVEEIITESPTSEVDIHKIPLNSNTLLVDESTSRFSSAEWYDKVREQRIVLAGLGGIGSYVAFLLGRLKPNIIYMYDPDRVETVNLSGQLYGSNHIGEYKANAIYSIMSHFSNFSQGVVRNRVYDESSLKEDVMICGFDNMEARKVFFYSWMNRRRMHISAGNSVDTMLYIDGRLAAEEFQVFAITGDDESAIERYSKEWLFNDEEVEETLCSYKQTTFMANMIGSVMVNIFVNHVANQCNPIFPRDVPFLTSYDASTMYFKVEK